MGKPQSLDEKIEAEIEAEVEAKANEAEERIKSLNLPKAVEQALLEPVARQKENLKLRLQLFNLGTRYRKKEFSDKLFLAHAFLLGLTLDKWELTALAGRLDHFDSYCREGSEAIVALFSQHKGPGYVR